LTSRDRLYLTHILDAIQRIESFAVDGRAAFLVDEKTQSAVMRQLEIIGEAAKQVSAEAKAQSPDVPWRAMAATRDRLIHGYFAVRLDIVWNVVENELPRIRKSVIRLL
jgi:uncharacterized protein with HEPN domain